MILMKVMVVLLVLFNLYFPASFAPLANNFNSVAVAQKDIGGVGSVNQSKFAHAGARGGGGGGGGHSTGGGGSSGGGGQSTRGGRGGAAVIPVFAAGAAGAAGAAAGQRNNHHGDAGICLRCRKDMILVHVATGLASVLLLYV